MYTSISLAPFFPNCFLVSRDVYMAFKECLHRLFSISHPFQFFTLAFCYEPTLFTHLLYDYGAKASLLGMLQHNSLLFGILIDVYLLVEPNKLRRQTYVLWGLKYLSQHAQIFLYVRGKTNPVLKLVFSIQTSLPTSPFAVVFGEKPLVNTSFACKIVFTLELCFTRIDLGMAVFIKHFNDCQWKTVLRELRKKHASFYLW